MQNSLNDFVGLTPDGRAIYSNVKDIHLAANGSKLCGFGQAIINFETQEMNLFGYHLIVEKHINPKYDSSAFLQINRIAHDLVEYNYRFSYAKVLWLSWVSVQSVNSGVSVKVEIIETDTEDEYEGISVSLIGALEDISQFDITEKDKRISITPNKSWGYVSTRNTYDNMSFDRRYHGIVGGIPSEELIKRKVVLTIKVPKGAEQYIWNKQGYRK